MTEGMLRDPVPGAAAVEFIRQGAFSPLKPSPLGEGRSQIFLKSASFGGKVDESEF